MERKIPPGHLTMIISNSLQWYDVLGYTFIFVSMLSAVLFRYLINSTTFELFLYVDLMKNMIYLVIIFRPRLYYTHWLT